MGLYCSFSESANHFGDIVQYYYTRFCKIVKGFGKIKSISNKH